MNARIGFNAFWGVFFFTATVGIGRGVLTPCAVLEAVLEAVLAMEQEPRLVREQD